MPARAAALLGRHCCQRSAWRSMWPAARGIVPAVADGDTRASRCSAPADPIRELLALLRERRACQHAGRVAARRKSRLSWVTHRYGLGVGGQPHEQVGVFKDHQRFPRAPAWTGRRQRREPRCRATDLRVNQRVHANGEANTAAQARQRSRTPAVDLGCGGSRCAAAAAPAPWRTRSTARAWIARATRSMGGSRRSLEFLQLLLQCAART